MIIQIFEICINHYLFRHVSNYILVNMTSRAVDPLPQISWPSHSTFPKLLMEVVRLTCCTQNSRRPLINCLTHWSLKNYMTGRFLLGSEVFFTLILITGVPQWYIIKSLLFTLFINNILQNIDVYTNDLITLTTQCYTWI